MLLAALLSAISFAWVDGSALFLLGGSVLYLVLFAGFVWLYRATLPHLQKRRGAISLLGGMALGLAQALGTTVKVGASLRAAAAMTPGYGLLFTALLCLLFAWADRQAEKPMQPSPKKGFKGWLFQLLGPGRKSGLLLWAVVALCWLPYLVIFWPGLVSLDVMVQMGMGLGVVPMTSHHPVMHTLFLGLCMRAGRTLFGSYAAGVGLATTLQLLATSCIIAAALRRMEKLGIAFGWRVGALAFYTVVPLVGWYSVTLWKDVWLASFTLLFALEMMQLVGEHSQYFLSRNNNLRLVLVTVGLILSKNSGIYLFILPCIAMLLCIKSCRRQLAALLLLGLVVFKLADGPLLALMGATHGDSREALSVPMLQVARTVRDNGENISLEDRALINEVLPYDQLPELYDYRVSDSIKILFNTEAFNAHKGEYLSLWLRLGLQNPRSYLLSLLEQTYGYWYPDVQHWIFAYNSYPAQLVDDGVNFGGLEDRAGQYHQPFAALQEKLLYGVATLRRVPALSMVYSIGFHFWLLLAAALYCLYKKQFFKLLPLALMVAVWLTCLASPVYAEFRYAYPAILSVPLMLGYCFGGPLLPVRATMEEKPQREGKPQNTVQGG